MRAKTNAAGGPGSWPEGSMGLWRGDSCWSWGSTHGRSSIALAEAGCISRCVASTRSGWPGLTRERHWMAAVLACGDGAMLSHRSAAALWEIGTERRGCVDVSVRRRAELRRPGLRVRGRTTLAETDTLKQDGIPVTSPILTLIDVATGARRIRRAAWGSHPAQAPRQAHLSPLRLGPGDPLPSGCGRGGSPSAADQTDREIKYEPARVRAELSRATAMLRKRASDIDHT